MPLLQIVTVTLVAVAMAMSLAHALELPGKMRLEKHTYYAIQSIYYPGFTIGGAIGEVGGVVSTAILLLMTPVGGADFWLTATALGGLIGMQAIYWVFTHPVNRFWVEGETMHRLGSRFFSFGSAGSGQSAEGSPEWTQLRNRWEYSHVARAALGFIGFVALVVAIGDHARP